MSFDPDAFVDACRQTLRESDPGAACADVVARELRLGTAIDDAFEAGGAGPVTLFCDDRLTVQRIVWPAGVRSAPHDHRMWAVVGVYRGEEHNIFHERSGIGLREVGRRVVAAGEVLSLPDTVIHSVANPSAQTVCGLHVYGGNIDGIERSQWLPNGRELPLREARLLYGAQWASVRATAADMDIPMEPERQFEAYSAVVAEMDRRKRLLEADEVQRLLADLWGQPAAD